jgi:hypothetical protein
MRIDWKIGEKPIMNSLEEYTGFLNLFRKVILENQKPEFPLDFLNPEMKRKYASYIYHLPSHGPLRVIEPEENIIYVEPYILEGNITEKLNRQAAELVIAAAIDKNIVVFDSHAGKKLTDRLIDLLVQVSGQKITDIFIRESKTPEERSKLIENWHLVPDKIWEEVESYYFNKMNGSLAQDDKNLVVVVSKTKNNFDFVHPVLNETENKIECGLGILSNQSLLLGSF